MGDVHGADSDDESPRRKEKKTPKDKKSPRKSPKKSPKKHKKEKKKKGHSSDSDDATEVTPKSASGLDMMHSLTETGDGKKVRSPKAEKLLLSPKELKKAGKKWKKKYGDLGGYTPSPATLAGWYNK